MTRGGFVRVLAAATATPLSSNRGIVTEVSLTREGDALLTPFVVGIALSNLTNHVVRLRFPTADLFRVDVLHEDAPVWSSVTGHKPIPVTRQIDVPPGHLKLAQQLVDGTTDDHRAFAPGSYTVRVALLGDEYGVIVDKQIAFAPPHTIAHALAAKPGTVLTLAGAPYVDGGVPRLRDQTGTVRLSRSLGLRPSGRWIVRGFFDALADERVFDVGRAAPAFENAPTPAAVSP